MLKKGSGENPDRCFACACAKTGVCLILFFCLSMICSCGTTHPSALQKNPPPAATVAPFHATTRTFDGDFTLLLVITPDHSGTNSFTIQVTDRAGQPADHVKVTLYTTMQDMRMGTDSIEMSADGRGHFRATSNVLSMGGHWAIGIVVQTTDSTLHKAGVTILLPS